MVVSVERYGIILDIGQQRVPAFSAFLGIQKGIVVGAYPGEAMSIGSREKAAQMRKMSKIDEVSSQ
jgi:hypothetical protein